MSNLNALIFYLGAELSIFPFTIVECIDLILYFPRRFNFHVDFKITKFSPFIISVYIVIFIANSHLLANIYDFFFNLEWSV